MKTKTTLLCLVLIALTGCSTPSTPSTGEQQVDPELMAGIIGTRHIEIEERCSAIRDLHSNLMLVGNSDEKYRTQLEAAAALPPSDATLYSLPHSVAELNAIVEQLRVKQNTYHHLLTIGNAGY